LPKPPGGKSNCSDGYKHPSSLSTSLQLNAPTLELNTSELGEFDLIKRPTTS